MTRTHIRKIQYIGGVLALGIAVFGSLYWFRAPPARAAAVKASDLGYRASWLDALMRRGSAALAGLEGHGKT